MLLFPIFLSILTAQKQRPIKYIPKQILYDGESVLHSLLDWNYLKQNVLLKKAKRIGKGNEWFSILSPQAVIYKAGSFSFTSAFISRDKGLISIIIPLNKIYILTKKDPLCQLMSEVTNLYPLKKKKKVLQLKFWPSSSQ